MRRPSFTSWCWYGRTDRPAWRAASWFRKLENASTLRAEWLMLLFNCSQCCPGNYLATIASTFRAQSWVNNEQYIERVVIDPRRPPSPHKGSYLQSLSDCPFISDTWSQNTNYTSSLTWYQPLLCKQYHAVSWNHMFVFLCLDQWNATNEQICFIQAAEQWCNIIQDMKTK